MRQSLNIEIVEKGNTQASALYEGGADTGFALEKVNTIIRETRNAGYKNVTEPIERAIWLLEMTGAGVDWNEKTLVSRTPYKVADCIDPFEGYLFITPRGIARSRASEDARVTILLDYESLIFSLYERYSPGRYRFTFGDHGRGIPLVEPCEERLFTTVIGFEDVRGFQKIVRERTCGVKLHDGHIIRWVESNHMRVDVDEAVLKGVAV